MSASLRFLALAVVGWVGLRAASLGMIPGAEAFTLRHEAVSDAAQATSIPPIAQTEFPPLEAPTTGDQAPLFAAAAPPMQAMPWQAFAPPAGRVLIRYYPQFMPAGYPSPPPAARRPLTPLLPDPQPLFYSPVPQLDDWPLVGLASAPVASHRSSVSVPQQSLPAGVVAAKLDRLQLTTWALLRGRQGMIATPNSLATGGTLGGSQAGARLTYNFSRELALSLRSSSPVGGRGGELAAGFRVTPLRSLPISFTVERRHAIGQLGGGRSAFAAFLEGGLYQRPVGWGFNLDAYAQAGVVGARTRDPFADGAFTLTRPIWGPVSGGVGMWGGVQPGLYRVDAGPRLSYRVRPNMRVHFDWRQRVAGNAEPGSGPAVTLAADF